MNVVAILADGHQTLLRFSVLFSARKVKLFPTSAMLLWACSLLAQTSNSERSFQEAVAAQQRGDDAVAVVKYRELLRTHPNAAVVRVNLGATLAHLKRYDEAIEQYRAVLASDSANRPARLNLALVYQEKGDLRRAVRELEILHRSEPSDPQSAMLLADCYVQLERYAEAVALLSPLEAVQPDDLDLAWLLGSALIHSGRQPEGVQKVEKAADKAADADAYLLAGETRLDLDQYDLARRDADAAMRLNPNLAGLQTLNGMILEHTGDFTGAEAALKQALQTDPNDFNAHFYLGSIFYFNRDMAAASLHLQRALQLRPSAVQARYKLALVARTEGHLDVALRELQTVVHESPNWLQPHVELAALYYRLHRAEDGAKERLVVDRLTAVQHPTVPKPVP